MSISPAVAVAVVVVAAVMRGMAGGKGLTRMVS
jgi:hypothetical protein